MKFLRNYFKSIGVKPIQLLNCKKIWYFFHDNDFTSDKGIYQVVVSGAN